MLQFEALSSSSHKFDSGAHAQNAYCSQDIYLQLAKGSERCGQTSDAPVTFFSFYLYCGKIMKADGEVRKGITNAIFKGLKLNLSVELRI